ncbi:MAG: ankyrin repeat domain-containing protein, partial [Candidatus Adiutrix sp.]|nr:ankyrin repeat domain-containing protein [Candidatus Adiutrix sp.]
LEAGLDPNRGLEQALIDSGRNKGVAQMLLAAGASTSPASSFDTPLHHAVAWGTEADLDMLLEAGTDPNPSLRPNSYMPLHYAAFSGRSYAVKRLLEYGADPAPRDEFGMTPLHWAAWRGDAKSCVLLLAAGAPADGPNEYDKLTPLFHAANLGGAPALAALLESASPNLRALLHRANDDEETPWDIAAQGRVRNAIGYVMNGAKFGLSRENLGLPRPGEKVDLEAWQRALDDRAECVRLLLAAGADPTRLLPENNTIFHSLFDARLGRYYFPMFDSYNGVRHKNPDIFYDLGLQVMPLAYPQSLRGLLRAGVPLPDLKEGRTWEDYCRQAASSSPFINMGARSTADEDWAVQKEHAAACTAVLKEESARRAALP